MWPPYAGLTSMSALLTSTTIQSVPLARLAVSCSFSSMRWSSSTEIACALALGTGRCANHDGAAGDAASIAADLAACRLSADVDDDMASARSTRGLRRARAVGDGGETDSLPAS